MQQKRGGRSTSHKDHAAEKGGKVSRRTISPRQSLGNTLPPPTADIKTVQECVGVGDEREGEGLRGGGGARAPQRHLRRTRRERSYLAACAVVASERRLK